MASYNEDDSSMDEKKIWRTFQIGIAIVALAPLLITRKFGLVSFRDTGAIGDTIGGITSPITSLIGSVLVFYALKAQIEANRLLKSQLQEEKSENLLQQKLLYLTEQISMVRTEINEFAFTANVSSSVKTTPYTSKRDVTWAFVQHNGSDAIRHFLIALKNLQHQHEVAEVFAKVPKLTELKNLLETIKSLFVQINIEVLPPEGKKYLEAVLNYQFNSKIVPAFAANDLFRSSRSNKCPKCGRGLSGIPEELFEVFDSTRIAQTQIKLNQRHN